MGNCWSRRPRRHNIAPEAVQWYIIQVPASKNQHYEVTELLRNENQHYNVMESPRIENQQFDVTDLTRSENQQNDVTELTGNENQQNDVTELTRNENQLCDFSCLPEHVWIIVMFNLEERDRLALAVTCQILYNICKTASVLWRSASVYLGNRQVTWNPRPLALNATEISVLQAHSHQIQEMEIVTYNSHGKEFCERSFLVLKEAAKKWPLKKLVIFSEDSYREVLAGYTYDLMLHGAKELVRYCLTSEKTQGLETLDIHCDWPHFDFGSDIFEMLKAASFTSSLKFLRLGTLTPTADTSYFISEMAQCVGRFQNLQQLTLLFEYLTDPVVEALSSSRNSQLSLLTLHGFVDSLNADIAITKWSQLMNTCPKLRVNLIATGWMNSDALLALFPPITPVSIFWIFYSPNDTEDDQKRKLLQLLPVYSKTLTYFGCFDETAPEIDNILIDMVKQCPNMFCLTTYGRIKSSSLGTLISMRNLQRLNVLASSVTFPESSTETREVIMSNWNLELSSQPCSCPIACSGCWENTEPIYPRELTRPLHFKIKCQPVQV